MKSTEIIQPIPLISPIAASGIKNSIPDGATGTNNASIEEGFPEMTMKAPIDGGLPPWGQDFNGLFYTLSTLNCNIQNGGLVTFSEPVSDKIGGYPAGAILDYVDENGSYSKVKSLIDDNTYNFVTTPSYIDGVHWEQIGITASTSWGNISGNIENQEDLQAVLNQRLNENQVTNCILSSTNANITNASVSDASYVNTGCTISEAGVASGFSADNRILLSKTMPNATASTVEIPFTTGSDVNTDQTLLYINNHANSLGISGGKIVLRYDGNVLSGTTTLAANTAYVALLTRTASNYTVQVKTAAGAYDDAEITLNSTVGYFAGKSIYAGGGDDSYFRGSIDLANLVIQENASNYWTYTTLSDFQTVTVSGTYQLLMPNGRNADKTLNNVTKTITLNDTLLYSPADGEKTVLVKEDGELMIRDYYAETYNQPADVPLNGVWMNKTTNTLTEQLNTYPNFINTGVTIASNGNVTGFSATAFIELPESYELGNSWEVNWNVDFPQDGESTIVYTPSEDDSTGFKAFKVTCRNRIATAQFKRPNVFVVNREITVSTAYEVTKTDTSGDEPTTVTGYVQTAGEAESYVTAGTQVYSDTAFASPLEQAAADTWTYTGEATVNTEVQTGYCKVGGVTLVPASTVVYSDANCTSVQATASGTDYTYSGDDVESIICTLTSSVLVDHKIGFNGSQYYLNDQMYASTDTVKDNVNITFGSDGETYLENLALADTSLTISGTTAWQWNGVSNSTQDFVPFVGAKLGKVTDDGTTITAMELDMPLTLAKDTDVVHNTGNEYIEGAKQFKNSIFMESNLANEPRIVFCTNYGVDITQPDLSNIEGGMLYSRDKNKEFYGCFQTRANSGNFVYSSMMARRKVGDAFIDSEIYTGVNGSGLVFASAPTYTGNYSDSSNKIVTTKYLADHWTTSAPTTSSTASKARPSVVVENYRDANGGFMKFSDRTLIQWSRASLGGSGTLNFYQAYASAESYIILGLRNAGSSTTNLGIKSFTANSVTYTNANTGNFHWVAIGTY